MDAADKRAKHIARIKNAVGDMKLILDDFLSLGKLEEGLIQANSNYMEAQEVFGIIGGTLYEMKVNLKKDQRIDFRHEGNAGVTIDKHLLKNVLVNLLSNAIKFSPEKTAIEVVCTITVNNFSLSVKDSGIGISDEDKQHLFERFFRAKNATNIQGTGLGLHIVARYLELMNGNIKMQSALNEGSVFTINVPQTNKTA
jgi:signal transduction histidine kinase